MNKDKRELMLFIGVPAVLLVLVFIAVYTVNAFVPDQEILAEKKIEGPSMVEYGINDGSIVRYHNETECSPGDICVFKFPAGSCTDRSKKCFDTETQYIKRFVKAENGCYYFIGNPSHYHTTDSRDYGCIKGEGIMTRKIVYDTSSLPDINAAAE